MWYQDPQDASYKYVAVIKMTLLAIRYLFSYILHLIALQYLFIFLMKLLVSVQGFTLYVSSVALLTFVIIYDFSVRISSEFTILLELISNIVWIWFIWLICSCWFKTHRPGDWFWNMFGIHPNYYARKVLMLLCLILVRPILYTFTCTQIGYIQIKDICQWN